MREELLNLLNELKELKLKTNKTIHDFERINEIENDIVYFIKKRKKNLEDLELMYSLKLDIENEKILNEQLKAIVIFILMINQNTINFLLNLLDEIFPEQQQQTYKP